MNSNPKDILEWLKKVFSEFIYKTTGDEKRENWYDKTIPLFFQNRLKIEFFNYYQRVEVIRQALADAEHADENDFTDYSNSDSISDAYVILLNTLAIARRKKGIKDWYVKNDTETLRNELQILLEQYQASAEMFKHLYNIAGTDFDIVDEGNKYIENYLVKSHSNK